MTRTPTKKRRTPWQGAFMKGWDDSIRELDYSNPYYSAGRTHTYHYAYAFGFKNAQDGKALPVWELERTRI